MNFQINLINDAGTFDISDYVINAPKVPILNRNLDFTIILDEIKLDLSGNIKRILDIDGIQNSKVEILVNKRSGFLGKVYDLPKLKKDSFNYEISITHYVKELDLIQVLFDKYNPVKPWDYLTFDAETAVRNVTNSDEWDVDSALNVSTTYSIKPQTGTTLTSDNGDFVTQDYGVAAEYIYTFFNESTNQCVFITNLDTTPRLHGLYDNQQIKLIDLFLGDSGGLTEGTIYYVYYIDEYYFELRTSYNGASYEFFTSRDGFIKYYYYDVDERELYKPVLVTGTTYKLKDIFTGRYLTGSTDNAIYIKEADTTQYNTIATTEVFSDTTVISLDNILRACFVGIGLNAPEYDFDISTYSLVKPTDFDYTLRYFDEMGLNINHLYNLGQSYILNPRQYLIQSVEETIDYTWLNVVNDIFQALGLVLYYKGNLTYGISAKDRDTSLDEYITDFDNMDKIKNDLNANRIYTEEGDYKALENKEFYTATLLYGVLYPADFAITLETSGGSIYLDNTFWGILALDETTKYRIITNIDFTNNFRIHSNESALGRLTLESDQFKFLLYKTLANTKTVKYTINTPVNKLYFSTSIYSPKKIEYDIRSGVVEITEAFAETTF